MTSKFIPHPIIQLTLGQMNFITFNHHLIPKSILFKQIQSYSYTNHQDYQHHGPFNYKFKIFFMTSGLGITLVDDKDHIKNFTETNFSTIQHCRSSHSRSNLPSFTPLNSKKSHSLVQNVNSEHFNQENLYPNQTPLNFNHSSPHSNQNVSQHHSILSLMDPNLVHHPNHSNSPSLSIHSASIIPSDSQKLSSFSHRLRNSHSLQFIKQKSPLLPNSNLNPNQLNHPSINPLVTHPFSHHHHLSHSLSHHSSQTTFPKACISSVDFPSPELIPTSSNKKLPHSTKFSKLVKSTLQKRSSRCHSYSQSTPPLDLKPERTHLYSSSSTSSSPYIHSSGSLTLSPNYENSQPYLLNTYTPPPPSMSYTLEPEIESLSDQRTNPDDLIQPLRSCCSQPLLNDNYIKTSLSSPRSHSALNSSKERPKFNRSSSSLSGMVNMLSSTTSNSGSIPHYLSNKDHHSNDLNSPPPKFVRTQFNRLAQFLAPLTHSKHSNINSNLKISPSISKVDPTPTSYSSSKSFESHSRRASSIAPDSLPLNFNTLSHSISNSTSNSIPMTIINWRNTITDREYRTILEKWGPTEIHRQQLIWELCQTEIAFLESVTLILDYFINPLKKSDCGTWVAGVPQPVQNFFSDLQEISRLHSEMIMAMSYNRVCEKKRNQSPVVIRFANMMASFVPRLRIYERYLVCFEHVCSIIDRLSAEQTDNFGVFVKIQSDVAGLGAMTLTSYLLKPIQRLMKYPLFFRQLDETTPPGHPDHSHTCNLWKATDGIIRSMQDVKGLEDDHNALKNLEEQLIGLPDGFVLANRRRKVVARGTFQRVIPSQKDILKLSQSSGNKFGSNDFQDFKTISSRRPPSSLGLRRESINNPLGNRMFRCLSPVSDSSENSQNTHSVNSYHSIITDSTIDLTKPHLPPITRAPRTSWSNSACSNDSSPCPDRSTDDWTSPKIKHSRHLSNKSSAHNLMKRGSNTELLEVILLSDLIVLCVKENLSKKNWRPSSKKSDDSIRLRLLNNIGISKLIEAEDIGGQLEQFEDLLRLELCPELIQSSSNNESESYDDNVIYLSSHNSSKLTSIGELKKSSRGSMGSWTGLLPSTTPNLTGISTEQDWKSWLKEFKKLELQTNHFYRRHLRHSEQKRRRSNNGKINVSIKRCSSMNNLPTPL